MEIAPTGFRLQTESTTHFFKWTHIYRLDKVEFRGLINNGFIGGGICLCKTALRHGIIQAVMVADKENFTCAQPWAVAQVKLLSAYAECTVNVIIRPCEPGAQNS